MNNLIHQPFNDWLFMDEPLSVEQTRQLQEHLHHCEHCRKQQQAWLGVQHLVRSTGRIAPSPGFAFRWQVRLAARRLERQHRIAWWFFLVVSTLALALIVLLGWQVLQALAGPEQVMAGVLYVTSRVFSLVESVQAMFGSVGHLLPPLSLISLMFFTGLVTMLCVLWVVVFRTLTMRRVVA